jgi:3,4-dihydroxy 2-butanone 4-phosphate synthase/GTP cyclohydrolase II
MIGVPEAIAAIRDGRILVVVDDEDRENEGDLIIAAERVTPEAVNFMATHGRGLICVPLTEERARALELMPMVARGTDPLGTAFTVSVDAARGTTTGISIAERTTTIRGLANPAAVAIDFLRPGHIFPLVARTGGVLRRAGHTEAAVDLARMAGLDPSGVICEILNEDGSMARLPDLERFAETHDLRILTIRDLIEHRRKNEELVEEVAGIRLPTRFGLFNLRAFEDRISGEMHLALIRGTVDDGAPVLCRVHSECLTGDLFHSQRCDCGDQLEVALETIAREDRGILLYMRQEGRGIGLKNKLKAYELQEKGCDTVEANSMLGFKPDLRDYGIGAQILVRLGVRRLRLITNNPRKIIGLSAYGIEVTERVPLELGACDENRRYLEAKRDKLGHLLHTLT